jgi:anti-anti-sigma factor
MDEGKILYAKSGDTYFIKLVGAVSFTGDLHYPLTRSFRAFIDQLFERMDFDNVVIDLTEATLIDSTNLGLLAEIAKGLYRERERKPVVFTTNPHVTKTLRIMGFHQIFTLCENEGATIEEFRELPPPCADVDSTGMILQAHRTLVSLSQENAERFQPVIDAIEMRQAEKAAEEGPEE